MNERLTIQDLTDLLAAKHSMAKKDAEAFVKEFFLLIEQALESEKTVKIKGLGTFKLIDVDSRESVHVHTGERFQIKGHTKVSFSPDTSLRDAINKPFAHFETVVLNENTVLEDTLMEDSEEDETLDEETVVQTAAPENEKAGDSIVETKTNAIEEEPMTVEEPTIVETVFAEEISEQQAEVEEQMIAESIDEKVEQLEEEEMPVAEEQPDAEENKPEEISEEQPNENPVDENTEASAEAIIEQELLKANLKPITPLVSPQPELAESAEPDYYKKENTNKEKSPVPYLITIIILVLLLCGGVVLFIYYPDIFSSSSAGKDNVVDVPVTTQPVQPGALVPDTIERKDTVAQAIPAVPNVVAEEQPIAPKEEAKAPAKTENKVVQQPQTSAYLDSATYKITGTKTKYTIKEGETLTKVSLRFYGTKAMWPYIVKHNPDVIKNPNNVPYGTTVKIPELTKE